LLVQQRVPGVRLRRQALAAHLQPQVVHLALRYHDRPAAVGQLVRGTAGVELVDDRARVRRGQVAEQRSVGRLGRPVGEQEPTRHDRDDPEQGHRLLPRRETAERLTKSLDYLKCPVAHQACILMMSLKAATALLVTATVSWVASE